jgi:hypothetical protein
MTHLLVPLICGFVGSFGAEMARMWRSGQIKGFVAGSRFWPNPNHVSRRS